VLIDFATIERDEQAGIQPLEHARSAKSVAAFA
jgi:hypothetical protein